MKKRLTVILIIVVVLSFSSVLFAEDFRNVNWGMTREEVKNREVGQLIKEDNNFVLYMLELNGYDFALIYIFYDNKLITARYGLMETFINNQKHIRVKDDFLELLKDKYGEIANPSITMLWSNDAYKGKPSKYGTAVSLGYLTYIYRWETDDMKIYLSLYNGEYGNSLMIEYNSKAHKEEIEKLKEFKQNKVKNDL